MEKLNSELHRILLKRVTAALERAKYYPATVTPPAEAEKVLRPWAPPLQEKT